MNFQQQNQHIQPRRNIYLALSDSRLILLQLAGFALGQGFFSRIDKFAIAPVQIKTLQPFEQFPPIRLGFFQQADQVFHNFLGQCPKAQQIIDF